MSKEKAAGGEKETSQGGVASEQTPHPSSCPPQAADRRRPFRCSSFSHTNRFAGFVWEPCPFANPLKTTKKGAAAPFLGFFPGLGLCRGYFKSTKRTTDAYWVDRRGHRNTLRLFQLRLEWQSVCARCARLSLQKGRSFDFHTSNIQRAQIEQLALCIVRLGNPILRPPEGRSLRDASSLNGTQKQSAFSGAAALFRVPSGLFFHIFSAKTEKIWPAERR